MKRIPTIEITAHPHDARTFVVPIDFSSPSLQVLSASVGFDARVCNAVNAAFHDLDQANHGLGSSGVGMSEPRELTEFPRLQRTQLLSLLRRASEMFFTTKPRGLGTGLGLALVRGVVERTGGRMELESREGMGTTVRLRLPSANLAIDPGTTRACVRGLSGRTTALLESLLSTHGIGLDRDGDLEVAEYWICAADAFEKHELIHWLLTRPATRVVIVGKLPLRLAREVASMGASLVTDTVDLLALQRAVDRVAATWKDLPYI